MNWRDGISAEFARQRTAADASVVEEMAQHAEAAFEAARADGMAVDAAEASVRDLIRSWCSQTAGPRRIERPPLVEPPSHGGSSLAGLGLDIRLAIRLLWIEPGFAFISAAMIALAIAAATTLFSVVDGVLLKPLPRVNTERLMRAYEAAMQAESGRPTFSNLTYHAWADRPETIEGLGAWNEWSLSYDGPSGLERVRGARITTSLFPLLGVSPALGLNFSTDQEITDDAVILSHGFWKERFGAAPDAIGRRLTLGGRPRTIIGVMPGGFEFPDREARVWLAQRLPPVVTRESENSIAIRITGHYALVRLKPGFTREQASAEAGARAAAASPRFPHPGIFSGGPRRIVLTPVLEWLVKDVKPALWILSAAVALLFAAAIGNVANMLLARATARQREVAIRFAMGAGGLRLIRLLLAETSVIAAIGGALGLGITLALLRVVPTLMPADFPRLDDIAVDGRVLAVAVGLTMTVSLVIGLLPARMARRVKLTSALVEDGAAPVGQSLRSPAARSRALIITGQVAIAALLLVGAALLSQSLFKLINIDRGYEPANLLTARLAHFSHGLPTTARPAFYNEVLSRLKSTRGVTHAALSNELPLGPAREHLGDSFRHERIEGEIHVVSTDYLAAMGMRLVRGRGFTEQDVPASELVILVNETFARRYLPADPLNVRLSLDLDADRPCAPTKAERSACTNPWTVVGIVADVRHTGANAPVQPEIFATRTQFLTAMPSEQYVIARTTGDPAALAGDLRAIVRTAGANGVIEQVMTMETRLMLSLARPRLYAVLLAGFAIFALLIAGIGLFGGLSYGVTQRTREIGVRTALGATPRDIVNLVVRQGAAMTLAGLAIGLGAAAATVRYLAGFLLGVTPLDPATFALVSASLLVVASAACAIPARRAARIDAITALRG